MLKYEEIQQVEIELSSFCNASCPLCPRNLFGYNTDLGYVKNNLTLDNIKTILTPEFLKQIEKIKFEGNFGDPLANPELLEIILYLNKPIRIVTNGYFRNTKFWKELAQYNVIVEFGIDGIDQDTHARYRRGTDLKKILSNAKAFINNGGNAIWKMIKFDFNCDQISAAKNMSEQMGFSNFVVVNHGRNSGPVFDQSGNLIDVIGDFQGSTDFAHYKNLIDHGEMLLEDIDCISVSSLECTSVNNKEIYISSTGNVFPCCFMGFSPETYGRGRWHQPVNQQLIPLINENNALIYSLEHCIQWFNKITLAPGNLVVCDSSCGRK